ncbi:hypothetical protein EBI01_04120 [Marinomonas rhizomae]|uniref:Uncharacterized protein n=1 Tax=Marinomonas rhizomae TaxID=491948 RepID=A0A366JCY3_9GAMM|nr:hypothetical protein [Marinomonas rhizomae]RBP84677.1 hypothetical protein DFP80_103147 [Marinomonas rhizomae]RNF75119.1 hypothetical protein EBI01_04120 [Marinomonas rhizomae]
MNDLWLGAGIGEADYVFVLPNKPVLPRFFDTSFLNRPNVSLLIELNGNHWRKIFTIMAKLTAPRYDSWKSFRDKELLTKVGIAFSLDQLHDYEGLVFVVGNTFRDELPVDSSAHKVGNVHTSFVYPPYVWCPYLDYRQFPNTLIEALREYILEKKC